MAQAVPFVGANRRFMPATGDEMKTLPIDAHVGVGQTITRWKLSERERDLFLESGDLWVAFLGKEYGESGSGVMPTMIISSLPMISVQDEEGNVIDAYDPDGGDVLNIPTRSREDFLAGAGMLTSMCPIEDYKLLLDLVCEGLVTLNRLETGEYAWEIAGTSDE